MAYKQLTQEQRYHLYEMKQMKLPQKDMAQIINVSEATISFELKQKNT